MRADKLREQAQALPDFPGADAVRASLAAAADRVERYEAALVQIADPENDCNAGCAGPWIDTAQGALGFRVDDGGDWYDDTGKMLAVVEMMERAESVSTPTMAFPPEEITHMERTGWVTREASLTVPQWAKLANMFSPVEYGIVSSQPDGRLIRNLVLVSPQGMEKIKKAWTGAAGPASMDRVLEIIRDGEPSTAPGL